jgi:hypothetical protein
MCASLTSEASVVHPILASRLHRHRILRNCAIAVRYDVDSRAPLSHPVPAKMRGNYVTFHVMSSDQDSRKQERVSIEPSTRLRIQRSTNSYLWYAILHILSKRWRRHLPVPATCSASRSSPTRCTLRTTPDCRSWIPTTPEHESSTIPHRHQ